MYLIHFPKPASFPRDFSSFLDSLFCSFVTFLDARQGIKFQSYDDSAPTPRGIVPPMVRGNSARRKELAARRRQDRKDEIARKRAGTARATPVEARARILAFCAEGQEARAWVASGANGKDKSGPRAVSYPTRLDG